MVDAVEMPVCFAAPGKDCSFYTGLVPSSSTRPDAHKTLMVATSRSLHAMLPGFTWGMLRCSLETK